MSIKNLWEMRLCKKLAARFIESFQILERKGRVAYKLCLLTNMKIHSIFHVLLLEKYKGNSDIADALMYELQNEEEEYEIEKIIDFKIKYN